MGASRLLLALAASLVCGAAHAQQGTGYYPGRGEYAALMAEDQWPHTGDLDYNDAVVLFNWAIADDGTRVTGATLTLNVQALGATYCNGLSLRVQTDAPVVATRRTGTATGPDGVPWSDATPLPVDSATGEQVVRLTPDLRADLCGGATGFLNTDPAVVSTTCAPAMVDLEFPTDPNLTAVPGDLFLVDCDDPSLEIHKKGYAPTAFGRVVLGDNSPGSPYAISGGPLSGLPWVIEVVPAPVGHPKERRRIDELWPDIVSFAATGTPSNYAETTIQTEARFDVDLPTPRVAPDVAFDDDVDGTCEGWDHDADAETPPICAGVAFDGDCDDADEARGPLAGERFDWFDHDCDGAPWPFGDGRDGDRGAGTLSVYATSCNSALNPGDMALPVVTTAGFTPGDVALVWVEYGNAAGKWAMHEITGVTGSQLDLRYPITFTAPSGNIWVERVPQYHDVTVASGTLVGPTWSNHNSPGRGITSFLVSGTLDIAPGASLTASGIGYVGGTSTSTATQSGEQGTSYQGTPVRGTTANHSGGGGSQTNSGAHWDGGGGGYATPGGIGDSYQNHWGGTWPGVAGAGGGTMGDPALTSLFFGGGGGSGGLDNDPGPNSWGGAGGRGGGFVLVSARTLILDGTISANGAAGQPGVYTGGASPGGGGGGAGGSVLLVADEVLGAAGTVRALGGAGGAGSEAGTAITYGGAGGDGRIRICAPVGLDSLPAAYESCAP